MSGLALQAELLLCGSHPGLGCLPEFVQLIVGLGAGLQLWNTSKSEMKSAKNDSAIYKGDSLPCFSLRRAFSASTFSASSQQPCPSSSATWASSSATRPIATLPSVSSSVAY